MKTRNFDQFWGPKWPDSQAPEAHILHTSNIAPTSMYSKIDVNPVEIFWQYSWKHNFDLFVGPKWPQNLGILGLSFTRLQKKPQQAYSSFIWIQFKFFHKIVKTLHFDPFSPNFDLFGSLKGPSEAHILHICKRTSNEHVRQDWYESNGIFWQSSHKPEFLPIWEPQITQKFGPLGPICKKPPNVAATSLSIKFHVNPVETVLENSWKPTYWPICAQFRVKGGPKIWPTGAIFHTHLKVPTMCHLTKFHSPTLKTFWENGPKPPKNHNFRLFL